MLSLVSAGREGGANGFDKVLAVPGVHFSLAGHVDRMWCELFDLMALRTDEDELAWAAPSVCSGSNMPGHTSRCVRALSHEGQATPGMLTAHEVSREGTILAISATFEGALSAAFFGG